MENLCIGDRIMTSDSRIGEDMWIGRQTVESRFGPAERLMPVRIAAGSLGGGLPHSDLTVTADHALLLDGVLCNAGALVNGTTNARVPLAEIGGRFTVCHIETEDHEIILAHGAAAETFIDNAGRRAFDNPLCGDDRAMTELPCLRAVSVRQVPAAIRARLSERDAA